ncbi:VOC family protein [Empedobacter brevis]|uniref:VOC family protein n=1 Tax=Empedobacter brevis TaxID=247 RepID=UPI002FE3CA3E
MFLEIHPKLPMRSKEITFKYYVEYLGFVPFLNDLEDYFMVRKDGIEIHFFKFEELIPEENYGQVYIRVADIELLYETFIKNKIQIHPNGKLQVKPWGQIEFSILDPDHNLLTFGKAV